MPLSSSTLPFKDFIVPPWNDKLIRIQDYNTGGLVTPKDHAFYDSYKNVFIEDMNKLMIRPYYTSHSSRDIDVSIDYGASQITAFWRNYYLYKHKADEQEDGEDIFIYSIVIKSQWDTGKRDIIDDPAYYMSWAKYLPEDSVEEVAANWFELLVEEEQLTSKYGIKVVT